MMKKFFLTAATTVTILFAQAQPKLTEFSVYEDFSTETDYIANPATNFGIVLWTTTNAGIVLTRDYTNKKLNVAMPQPAYQYNAFGIAFGDSNGAATGGVANTIDLSGNGKFSFDIINTGTEGLSMRVSCTDINDVQIDCSPGALVFGDIWKYQIQIVIPAGDTVTFKAGTPNGAGGGIINDCDFSTGVWGDYVGGHVIRTNCDLTQIKQINLTVLNSAKNAGDGHAFALINGQFSIQNFIVGDTSSTAASAPTPLMTIPITSIDLAAKGGSKATIDYTANGRWSATSDKSWLTVRFIKATTGEDSLTFSAITNMTTSARTATVTFTAIGGESKTVTVTQAAAGGVGIDNLSDKKSYSVVGNTIFFNNTETSVFTISGQAVSSNGNSSVTLPKGFYIVNSPNGSETIEIKE